MKALRQLPGRLKRKLLGYSLPALDLLEIHVVFLNGKILQLHFAKDVRIEIIRQSISLQADAEQENVQLLHGDSLLDDNQLISDLSSADQNKIEIIAIISRFKNAEGFFWRGQRLNPFPDRSISDFAIEQSVGFYKQNKLDLTERRNQLKGLISEMNVEGQAIAIMAFNTSFSPMFINWVRSCDTHKIAVRERTIIFPMDEKSCELAVNEGFKVCYDKKSRVLKNIGSSEKYGDTEFRKHMFFQNAIIRDVLALGCNFLFQDVDLVWLEDPFEYFTSNEAHDIEFMFDGRTSRHGPLCVNSGFIFLRSHPATISFWEIIYQNYERVVQFRSQQEPLNRYLGMLHNRGLKVNILPEEFFANGHLFGPEQEKSRLPEKAKVIHCSWTDNLEQKIIKYKNNKLWYIDNK